MSNKFYQNNPHIAPPGRFRRKKYRSLVNRPIEMKMDYVEDFVCQQSVAPEESTPGVSLEHVPLRVNLKALQITL